MQLGFNTFIFSLGCVYSSLFDFVFPDQKNGYYRKSDLIYQYYTWNRIMLLFYFAFIKKKEETT